VIHMLRHLGTKENLPERVDISIPVPFIIDCPECHNPYSFRSEDIQLVERPNAPPPDFRDKI
jgi:hypothetical protein